jgi:hypothetical protein
MTGSNDNSGVSAARAAKVADYVQEYMDGLHHHHGLEDELIRPLPRSRAGAQDDLVARMELQHHAIDATLTRATALLPRWRTSGGDAAAGAEPAAARDEHQALSRPAWPAPAGSRPPCDGPRIATRFSLFPPSLAE